MGLISSIIAGVIIWSWSENIIYGVVTTVAWANMPMEQVDNRIREIAMNYRNLDAFIDAIIGDEKKYEIPPAPGFEDTAKRIKQILCEE